MIMMFLQKLKELYKAKDYGRYVQNGEIPVCFIANNHTSGGNSGSPVINADGQLIGVNFDRAWEGVASDMSFNPGIKPKYQSGYQICPLYHRQICRCRISC